MTNAQVEDAGRAVAAALQCRQVRDAVGIDKHMKDGPIDANIVEIPGVAQNGNNAYRRLGMIHLHKRWICIRRGAFHREPIEVRAQRMEIQCEILKMNRHAQALARF